MPRINSKKLRCAVIPEFGSADVKDMPPVRPESIQEQLEEAHFISRFMAAVYTSMELDDICSIAARALYKYAPYHRIVFAFSGDLEARTVSFTPKDQKDIISARPKLTVVKSNSYSDLQEATPASAHVNLLDNMGTIAIDFIAGQTKTFSVSILESVSAYFSHAIRNAIEHSRMKDLAMRDGLTRLFNRRIFDETLAQKVKCQDTRPVSLLLIDLDDFKQVNDNFGHQAGDQVLKTVARILKESCRGNDLVARFGGEEFAIILSQTQADTAHAVAQRIRNRLEKNTFTFDGRQHQITASIGLATCLEGSTIFTSNLVNRADRALYQAKRTGKNKVCVSPSDLLCEERHSLDADNFGSFIHATC